MNLSTKIKNYRCLTLTEKKAKFVQVVLTVKKDFVKDVSKAKFRFAYEDSDPAQELRKASGSGEESAYVYVDPEKELKGILRLWTKNAYKKRNYKSVVARGGAPAKINLVSLDKVLSSSGAEAESFAVRHDKRGNTVEDQRFLYSWTFSDRPGTVTDKLHDDNPDAAPKSVSYVGLAEEVGNAPMARRRADDALCACPSKRMRELAR